MGGWIKQRPKKIEECILRSVFFISSLSYFNFLQPCVFLTFSDTNANATVILILRESFFIQWEVFVPFFVLSSSYPSQAVALLTGKR